MNYVRSNRDRQVATYRPRLGGQRICSSNEPPKSLDNVRPLKNHKHHGTRGHMVDEFLEERFSLVDAVERLCLLVCDLVQPQLFEREPFSFKPGEDLAYEAVLDCVRFEKCESSLASLGQRPFSLFP